MNVTRIVSQTIWMMVLGFVAVLAGSAFAQELKGSKAEEQPAATASHKVVACYFHRTVRCPTCKKISAYIDEAVKDGYAAEIKAGKVEMILMDFQDPKNQKFTEAYKISGPTLVLMDVHDGKVTSWKPAPKVWSLVGKKDQFLKYVQDEVRSYLDAKPAAIQARR
jgi:hypothetical protein